MHLLRISSAVFAKATSKSQDYLEADPYWEQKDIPMQLFKAKEPFIGKVVSVKRVVGPQAVGETCDIIIDHQGKMPYWEGQSYGVIPPGKRALCHRYRCSVMHCVRNVVLQR